MGVPRLNSSGESDPSGGAPIEVHEGCRYDERPSGAHPVAREHETGHCGLGIAGLAAPEPGARSAPSEAWERLGEHLRSSLSHHVAVLLQGEPGVGKRYSVHALHQSGLLSELGTLTDAADSDALELELSAWTKVSGAASLRTPLPSSSGFWRKATPGTLVVHEIARISLEGQARLHEALHRFASVDSGQHPRVIATSSDDLERAAASGALLPELFAALRASRVWLAPLRARRHEIEPLARRFFDVAKARTEKTLPLSICPLAMARLCGYDWPGNIAELEKVVEAAIRSCTTPTLGVDDLCAVQPEFASTLSVPAILAPEGVDLRHAVEAFENSLILQALARTRWNKNQAAKLLGLNRTTLVEMLKRKRIREA